MYESGRGGSMRGGTILEGKAGLAVAIALAAAVLVLAAVQWAVLPDTVVTHLGAAGAATGYSPKWMPILISVGLGLVGAGWLAAARAKTGLVLAMVGLACGVIDLVVNGVLF